MSRVADTNSDFPRGRGGSNRRPPRRNRRKKLRPSRKCLRKKCHQTRLRITVPIDNTTGSTVERVRIAVEIGTCIQDGHDMRAERLTMATAITARTVCRTNTTCGRRLTNEQTAKRLTHEQTARRLTQSRGYGPRDHSQRQRTNADTNASTSTKKRNHNHGPKHKHKHTDTNANAC